MLVHVVADYGYGDLAFAEVAQRIKLYLPDAEPILTPVAPFATLAAGFCVAQLSLNEAPPGTIIYHNVAPREDAEEERTANEGEQLAFALLPNGVRVVGVNAGYVFSFVREAAEELHWVAVGAGGSQFRSRDLFPKVVADIASGRSGTVAEQMPLQAVPEVPGYRLAYVDGYGNLKTTIKSRAKEMPASGSMVRVTIGEVELEATASDGSFEIEAGKLAFAPGSSGWKSAAGEEVVWIELFLRGGSAWQEFGQPPLGAELKIELE